MTKESDRRKAFAFPNAENTLKFTEWLSLEGTTGDHKHPGEHH